MPTADHAKEILEQVAARYASITSYSDRGAVRRQRVDNDGLFTTTFSTLYKKPLRYRFEFERPHPYPPLQNIITRNVLAFDGSTAYTWTQRGADPPQIKFAESLSLAIAAATGVSSGSAHRIGKLLIPTIGGLSLLDLVDLRQGTDTVVDVTPCYSVAARYPKCATPDLEFVIEKDALLIRRIKTSGRSSGFSATEMRDNIRVDAPIDDAVFSRAA